jgi:hypothetical protein
MERCWFTCCPALAIFVGDVRRASQTVGHGSDVAIVSRLLLDTIAARAQRWYDDNVRFPSSLNLTARLPGPPNVPR